jgi:hypothetical protein
MTVEICENVLLARSLESTIHVLFGLEYSWSYDIFGNYSLQRPKRYKDVAFV